MAAPMVSAAVALLLQDEPGLTPDQVKYRLMATANKSWAGYMERMPHMHISPASLFSLFFNPPPPAAGAGYLDIYAAVNGSTQTLPILVTSPANCSLRALNLSQ